MNETQKGFSLIEVMMSLGLLAAVVISMTGVFVLGTREVYGGRRATEALAEARSIVEEMEGWSFHWTYQTFGFDGTATSYVVDTRTHSYAAQWQATLTDKLENGYAIIDIDSLGPVSAPPLDSTRAIRVRVTVYWAERSRSRSLQLATVRM